MAGLPDSSSSRSQNVGFDCEFVNKPPQQFQTDCPICHLVLREPFLVNCCGYSFCKVCIEKVKLKDVDQASCPCCKEGLDIFPNKGLQRSLYGFKVYCSNKKFGCKWIGELGQLDGHLLNVAPQRGRQQNGCQFVKVSCSYCSNSFLRSTVKTHEGNECLKRPYRCEYCDFESTYGEVTTSHWSECRLFPTPCPNRCGLTLQRQNLKNHITTECPETVVECDFKRFGCDRRLARKDVRAHVNDNFSSHIGQLAQMVVRLEAENQQLKRQLECLKINTPTTALCLVMSNVERYKREGKPWISPSFYTQGYKLRLQVYVNDHGNDGSLCTTIFACLMQGKFDDELDWPFRGTIVVELITENGRVMYTDRIIHESKRVTVGSIGGYGRGVTAVHDGLVKNVKNDCLYFRIPAVQLSMHWWTNKANIIITVPNQPHTNCESIVYTCIYLLSIFIHYVTTREYSCV